MNLRGSNWAEQTDRGAVLGRDRVEVVGGAQAAGARHVLHHDIGIARDVAAEMARQQARDDVVTAARPVADDQIDLLALVEILHRRLGPRGGGKADRHEQQRNDTQQLPRRLMASTMPQSRPPPSPIGRGVG